MPRQSQLEKRQFVPTDTTTTTTDSSTDNGSLTSTTDVSDYAGFIFRKWDLKTNLGSQATSSSTTCISGSYGLSNGDGYLGYCCLNSNDCINSCSAGVCNGNANPNASSSVTTTAVSTSITSTTTTGMVTTTTMDTSSFIPTTTAATTTTTTDDIMTTTSSFMSLTTSSFMSSSISSSSINATPTSSSSGGGLNGQTKAIVGGVVGGVGGALLIGAAAFLFLARVKRSRRARDRESYHPRDSVQSLPDMVASTNDNTEYDYYGGQHNQSGERFLRNSIEAPPPPPPEHRY